MPGQWTPARKTRGGNGGGGVVIFTRVGHCLQGLAGSVPVSLFSGQHNGLDPCNRLTMVSNANRGCRHKRHTPWARAPPPSPCENHVSEQHEVLFPHFLEPSNLAVPFCGWLFGDQVFPVIRGRGWHLRKADPCPATFCPCLQCVILMHLHRHGCPGLDDVLFGCWCRFTRCAQTTSLSEQQEMMFPSFSVLLPVFLHGGRGGGVMCDAPAGLHTLCARSACIRGSSTPCAHVGGCERGQLPLGHQAPESTHTHIASDQMKCACDASQHPPPPRTRMLELSEAIFFNNLLRCTPHLPSCRGVCLAGGSCGIVQQHVHRATTPPQQPAAYLLPLQRQWWPRPCAACDSWCTGSPPDRVLLCTVLSVPVGPWVIMVCDASDTLASTAPSNGQHGAHALPVTTECKQIVGWQARC